MVFNFFFILAYQHILGLKKDALPSILYIRYLLESESISFPALPPSMPLKLYILHYLNHEPLEDGMNFLSLEDMHEIASQSQSSLLESFDFDETSLSCPIDA